MGRPSYIKQALHVGTQAQNMLYLKLQTFEHNKE